MALGRMGDESAIQEGSVPITVGEEIYLGGWET